MAAAPIFSSQLQPTYCERKIFALYIFPRNSRFLDCKAYIPLRRKIPGIGGWRWTMPPRQNFALGIPIFWHYLMLKFAFSLTPTPDASQWNIGCVGSQRKMLALAMYISCFLCRFHLRWYPTRTPFPVEYGLYSDAENANSSPSETACFA